MTFTNAGTCSRARAICERQCSDAVGNCGGPATARAIAVGDKVIRTCVNCLCPPSPATLLRSGIRNGGDAFFVRHATGRNRHSLR